MPSWRHRLESEECRRPSAIEGARAQATLAGGADAGVTCLAGDRSPSFVGKERAGNSEAAGRFLSDDDDAPDGVVERKFHRCRGLRVLALARTRGGSLTVNRLWRVSPASFEEDGHPVFHSERTFRPLFARRRGLVRRIAGILPESGLDRSSGSWAT